MPNDCARGEKFDVTHALSCKLGGFVTLRHDEIRDITAELLKEVCNDVRKEPLLIEPNLEDLNRQANKNREARLDVSARNFWTNGQRAFFDIRVFNLDARRHKGTEVEKCFERNEKEKKRHYERRVLEIENGTFTPLVFDTNGGMGKECMIFYKRLAEMVAEKKSIKIQFATNAIRTRIAFSLLRSTIRCVRGSKSIHNTNRNNIDIDISEDNSNFIFHD